jgi:RNA polymerase sigma-70 factor (ECF subfamily)
MRDLDFADWYRQERPKVLAALSVLSGERDVAADATDEAFARAYARWPRVRRMASPGGWTYRVALNALRTTLRRRARSSVVGPLTAGVVPDADVELWELVRALPDRQRQAVVLRYVADLPEAEIATAMGVRRGTVSSTLAAARARLLEALREEERSDHG